MGRPKGSKNKTNEEKALALIESEHAMRKPEWIETHALIFNTVKSHWVANTKVMSNRQIAEATGLSYETVRRHMASFDPDEMHEMLKEQAAMMVQPILWGLYGGAMKGMAEPAKILLKLGANFTMNDNEGMANNTVIVMNDEDIVKAESKLLKLSRRVKRDHKSGIVEGEVVDATENA